MSLLTIHYLEWYLCADRRVLCVCVCLRFMCIVLYVCYVLYRPDQRVQRLMRPEGLRSDRIGGSNELDQTGRSNELWDWRVPLRHIDRRVIPSYSLEWLMCCMWYFVNSLSFVLTVYVLCVSGFSGSRDDIGLIVHTRERVMRILDY